MLLTRYLLDATHCCDSAHAYTSVFIHNMHNHSVTTQTLIMAHLSSRGVCGKSGPYGKLTQGLNISLQHPPPHNELWVSDGWWCIKNALGSASNMRSLSQTVWVIWLGRLNWMIRICISGAVRGWGGPLACCTNMSYRISGEETSRKPGDKWSFSECPSTFM